MNQVSTEFKKKIFIIISGNESRRDLLSDLLKKHYEGPTIFTSDSSRMGLSKIEKTPPDVVIIDTQTEANNGVQVVEALLSESANPRMYIIVVGHPPEQEKFLDEIAIGKISFIDEKVDEKEFTQSLVKALNFNSQTELETFQLHYMAPGDLLIKKGDKAEFVYILKRGKLQAFDEVDGKKIVIGNISEGEFVGEMAYINNEPRSASVDALTDAELIKIPIDHIGNILYKRPSWSKALMQTLSKRLKVANKKASS